MDIAWCSPGNGRATASPESSAGPLQGRIGRRVCEIERCTRMTLSGSPPPPTILDCARADDLVGCTSPPYGRQPDTQPSPFLPRDRLTPPSRAGALNRTPATVKPATPRRRPTRPVAATVGVAPRAPASMKNSKPSTRPPREKDRTPLVRASALLLMAGLLYLLWPSAETAYLAMESVIR
ncbi:hypothetical protein Bcep18194_C6976 [Burkholderia lata]|uniref:Uncharacterized protein n=2 Tax=Burkholderia lata (strain ATCC 17760 / DSM 23089 / LMG 22485 / NCIMB 9086 / R18194 / 383) TaxID=482957 RepID=Q39NE4_BURL3|nr:hypothetical protein Bcep18194_C6976 [Burkholderia lata]